MVITTPTRAAAFCHVGGISYFLFKNISFSNFQVPVAVGASAYEAVFLYKGTRVVMSSGEAVITWKVHQLILYCCCGILAGIVGGLLGLGGGFILGPLFLELGIPPQVRLSFLLIALV